jgi:endonuclease-3
MVFQLMFAIITPALITGAFAERIKFWPLMLFCGLWVTIVYFPLAHMVWYWSGPDFLADNPADMAALGVEGLIPYINSIGLFRNKAKNVIALSEIILKQHGGEVPLNRADLEALPGVGRKTASVVLNELGIEPAIAVDTHVFRVSHRLKLSAGKTPDKVEQDLMAIVPEPYLTRAHHWLILHGRYVCVARKPKCLECRVADLCPSRELFMGG